MCAIESDRVRAAAEPLIGRPYEDHGRGPRAYNCLGVLLALVREAAGIELPDPLEETESGIRRLRERFLELGSLAEFRPLDVIWRRVHSAVLRSPTADPGPFPLPRRRSPELAVAIGDGYVVTAVHGGRVVRFAERAWTRPDVLVYRLKEFAP